MLIFIKFFKIGRENWNLFGNNISIEIGRGVSSIFQVIISLICIIASVKKGDWGNFDRYYPTLLYLGIGNLSYEFIAHTNFHLWEITGNGKLSEVAVDFFYLFFIVIPAIFVYLSDYPSTRRERIFHILKWITIFTVTEWVGGTYFDAIAHHNRWNIWWSLLFNFIMFPMLRLHYLYYKRALVLSIPITFFLLFWFNYI
jgi:hypothetical protein